MKRGILFGFVLVVVVIGCLGAVAPRRPKYWQDTILKPNQGWIEDYGHNPDDVLAFNVRSILLTQQTQARTLQALKAEIDALKTDPNE